MKQEQLIKNIKLLILLKGMKQCAVAKKAGLSVKCFSDMLNNRRVIRGDDIPRIAAALGATYDELFYCPVEQEGTLDPLRNL